MKHTALDVSNLLQLFLSIPNSIAHVHHGTQQAHMRSTVCITAFCMTSQCRAHDPMPFLIQPCIIVADCTCMFWTTLLRALLLETATLLETASVSEILWYLSRYIIGHHWSSFSPQDEEEFPPTGSMHLDEDYTTFHITLATVHS